MNETVVLNEWVLMLIIFVSVLSGSIVGVIMAISFRRRPPARLG